MRKIEKIGCLYFPVKQCREKINELVDVANFFLDAMVTHKIIAPKQIQEPERKEESKWMSCPDCGFGHMHECRDMKGAEKEPECEPEKELKCHPYQPSWLNVSGMIHKSCDKCGSVYWEKPAKKECEH